MQELYVESMTGLCLCVSVYVEGDVI
jgi:hypothetical protein